MQRRALKRIIFGWISLIVIIALLGKVTIAAPKTGSITTRVITPDSRTVAKFTLTEVGDEAGGTGTTYTTVSGS
ncbi:MAG: hypothetical protein ACE5K8_05015 [Candidatus Zixiibacteriota bacterium]